MQENIDNSLTITLKTVFGPSKVSVKEENKALEAPPLGLAISFSSTQQTSAQVLSDFVKYCRVLEKFSIPFFVDINNDNPVLYIPKSINELFNVNPKNYLQPYGIDFIDGVPKIYGASFEPEVNVIKEKETGRVDVRGAKLADIEGEEEILRSPKTAAEVLFPGSTVTKIKHFYRIIMQGFDEAKASTMNIRREDLSFQADSFGDLDKRKCGMYYALFNRYHSTMFLTNLLERRIEEPELFEVYDSYESVDDIVIPPDAKYKDFLTDWTDFLKTIKKPVLEDNREIKELEKSNHSASINEMGEPAGDLADEIKIVDEVIHPTQNVEPLGDAVPVDTLMNLDTMNQGEGSKKEDLGEEKNEPLVEEEQSSEYVINSGSNKNSLGAVPPSDPKEIKSEKTIEKPDPSKNNLSDESSVSFEIEDETKRFEKSEQLSESTFDNKVDQNAPTQDFKVSEITHLSEQTDKRTSAIVPPPIPSSDDTSLPPTSHSEIRDSRLKTETSPPLSEISTSKDDETMNSPLTLEKKVADSQPLNFEALYTKINAILLDNKWERYYGCYTGHVNEMSSGKVPDGIQQMRDIISKENTFNLSTFSKLCKVANNKQGFIGFFFQHLFRGRSKVTSEFYKILAIKPESLVNQSQIDTLANKLEKFYQDPFTQTLNSSDKTPTNPRK